MPLSPQRAAMPARVSPSPPDLIGRSPSVDRLRTLAEAVSPRVCTVLIHGESGTGKELVARHIHAVSPRRAAPFVPVDCTTLRDTLFESQLFGHVKGAFTGAERATLGFFRTADGGTLFLDEIGEMSLPAQAKLLRCIQDRAVVPLGGVDPVAVDVRIITATHRDLKAMVRAGEFRQDLYFRLNVVRLEVPPLRERRSDIPLLAEHFLGQLAETYRESAKTLSPEVLPALTAYAWPGNVRELANILERAHVLSPGREIAGNDLPDELRAVAPAAASTSLGRIPTLDEAERALIIRALRAADGNQSRAAQILQIERRRMYRKVHVHGLEALTRKPGD